MSKQLDVEIKVGLFVTLGVGLLMVAILVLGSTEGLMTRKARFTSHFPGVEGLVTGAKVVLGGIHVGTVDSITFDMSTRDVQVDFNVKKESAEWLRADSTAEVATQGVLGDKYISLTPGTAEQPILAPGSEIPNRPGKSITQFLSKGDQLLVNLNSLVTTLDRSFKSFEGARSDTFFKGISETAKNLSSASAKLDREMEELRLRKITRNLDSILEKINGGSGTLGALVNDPSLYDDAKKLVGEANRNRIVRNLVRQSLKEADEKAQKEKGKVK